MEGGADKRRVRALISEAANILGRSESIARRHRSDAIGFLGEVQRAKKRSDG
ncbi:MAG: hypothetical protein V4449_01790 [Patescibacteria group bacterium]